MRIVIKLITVALLLVGVSASAVDAGKKPVQKPSEASRARGMFIKKTSDAMSIVVFKNVGGSLVPVDPGAEFKSGDQIKIQFASNFDGFVYVLNIAPGGKRCILFPYPEAADNAVHPEQRYDIPPGGDAIEFDQEKGTEVLQVVMSRDRIPYLDAALKEPGRCLSESATTAAAELQAGIVKNATPVIPQDENNKVRSRDIILASGKDRDSKGGSVVAVPDNGGGGKLKSGEFAPFEIRLKHN
ncbi:MAG TPA: DUF4384 domain-containing protein [Blastocatellia bacterium]|nr:DUF4384 domain-containing protein [Blastocatellia bacterium]